MIIDEVTFTKNGAIIFSDGKEYLLNSDCIILHGIQSGSELSTEEFKSLIEESDYINCKNYLFRQIARYSKTEQRYKDKLYEKGFHSKAVNASIEYAKQNKYIDDVAFSERYYEKNKNSKGLKRILYELKNMGVKTSDLTFLENESNGKDVLTHLIEKFMKNREKSLDNRNKLYRHLATKGFGYSEISSAVSEYFSKID